VAHDAHITVYSSGTGSTNCWGLLEPWRNFRVRYRVIHRLITNALYSSVDPDIALQWWLSARQGVSRQEAESRMCWASAYKTYAYFFRQPAINATTDVAQRPLR